MHRAAMYGTYSLATQEKVLRRMSTRQRMLLFIVIAIFYCMAVNLRQESSPTPPDVAGPLGCLPLPRLDVFRCPTWSFVTIGETVINRAPYPDTTVGLCFTDTTIELSFVATQQNATFVNTNYGHNDNIWEYNVMETFLALGASDPTEYFEFEVSPTNQTYSAFILNPRKDFSPPVGHFFVGKSEAEARALGIAATTIANIGAGTWQSNVTLPLALFNVEAPSGTEWRMNFLRKITDEAIFPRQECGAWNAPNQDNFHETACFGRVFFA
ncbi:hypothetical protein ACHHYP_08921 [Achlya hypogyna]|uniref:Carbohydrate-binding domain-containing protein n=1 Tax=Achlya hypogyna TaxID=1202772 RepID=A0A1V9ZK11_ACHHY|nr:hypothetical protein ACHHYP_08921 [Achlya hypogyna]